MDSAVRSAGAPGRGPPRILEAGSCFLVCGRLQCGTFPGIIPVFDLFLITGEWYWEVVFESGIWHF